MKGRLAYNNNKLRRMPTRRSRSCMQLKPDDGDTAILLAAGEDARRARRGSAADRRSGDRRPRRPSGQPVPRGLVSPRARHRLRQPRCPCLRACRKYGLQLVDSLSVAPTSWRVALQTYRDTGHARSCRPTLDTLRLMRASNCAWPASATITTMPTWRSTIGAIPGEAKAVIDQGVDLQHGR